MSESDTDEIESIRERKRRELMERAEGETPASDTDSGRTAEAPGEPIHIESPEHFQEITREYDVVLVDYYADWCGPCRMLAPIVEDLARETPAAVAKVDIDRQQALAQQAGVRGVPTLHLYADGEPVERMVGVQDKAILSDLIGRYT